MAFPVVDSITVSTFSTAATAHLVTMPATVNSGDLLTVLFSSAWATPDTVATPSGWSLLSANSRTNIQFGVYYKIADGTEDGTTVDFVTTNARKAVAQVYRISAWHGTTPPEVGTAANLGDTQPDPPSLTPSWGADDTLWLASFGSAGNPTITVVPTSYTNENDDSTTTPTAATVGSARRELNATSDDPSAYTITASQNWVAQTLAVRPSAGGTPHTRTVESIIVSTLVDV